MKIQPEPERLDARVPIGILAITFAALVLGAILTVGVRALAEQDLHARAAVMRRTPVSPEAISTQSALFERHVDAPATRQPPQGLLEYGWSDRDRGLIHIPIERAKRLYLERRAAVKQPVSPGEERPR